MTTDTTTHCTVHDSGICSAHSLCDANYTGAMELIQADWRDFKQALEEIELYCKKLGSLQYLMYAEGKRSLLICLQAMDAGGKDGAVNHVLGAMNPQGCTVEFATPI